MTLFTDIAILTIFTIVTLFMGYVLIESNKMNKK
jgi:uncharacterized membrane protein